MPVQQCWAGVRFFVERRCIMIAVSCLGTGLRRPSGVGSHGSLLRDRRAGCYRSSKSRKLSVTTIRVLTIPVRVAVAPVFNVRRNACVRFREGIDVMAGLWCGSGVVGHS